MARLPLRLLVLGDSIAYGTGALRAEDTLGRRLSAALTADGFDVDLHVLAVPGRRLGRPGRAGPAAPSRSTPTSPSS